MTTPQHFVAKQRVKYIWKALRSNVRPYTDVTEFQGKIDDEDTLSESFWEYEQTPRTL